MRGGRRRRDVEDFRIPRHELPVPAEMRERQPFVLDARAPLIIAPWPPTRTQPGDAARLQAVLERLNAMEELPDEPVWFWPDRPPTPIGASDPGPWLRRWAQDRAVYALRAAA